MIIMAAIKRTPRTIPTIIQILNFLVLPSAQPILLTSLSMNWALVVKTEDFLNVITNEDLIGCIVTKSVAFE